MQSDECFWRSAYAKMVGVTERVGSMMVIYDTTKSHIKVIRVIKPSRSPMNITSLSFTTGYYFKKTSKDSVGFALH